MDQTVIVSGGRIAATGPSAGVSVPAGAKLHRWRCPNAYHPSGEAAIAARSASAFQVG